MISAYVREQEKYTRQELCGILRCGEDEAGDWIRRLEGVGVLREAGRAREDLSELAYGDALAGDAGLRGEDARYSFSFVGVIAVCGRILKCYPKYVRRDGCPKEALRQAMRVLWRHGPERQDIRMFRDGDEGSPFRLLSVLLFLMDDYDEHGAYGSRKEIIERDGPGEILWGRTVSGERPILSGGRPYYASLWTRRSASDKLNYFRRLHECVLTKASRVMEEADLLDLLEIGKMELSEEEIGDFGERDAILYRIERELGTQFRTREQLVLRALHAVISQGGTLLGDDALSMVGTGSFPLVWEHVCSDILGNQLALPLGSLPLPIPLRDGDDGRRTLLDVIERPLWSAAGRTARDTLIPDIVRICGDRLLIFDAKYYDPILEPDRPPTGQPGVESIVKQYMYQLAYRKFARDHGFSEVRNFFLLPADRGDAEDMGTVSLPFLDDIGLSRIEVRKIPAEAAFDCYLSGKRLDVSLLGL